MSGVAKRKTRLQKLIDSKLRQTQRWLVAHRNWMPSKVGCRRCDDLRRRIVVLKELREELR